MTDAILPKKKIVFNDYAEVVNFVFKALENFERTLHKQELASQSPAKPLRGSLSSKVIRHEKSKSNLKEISPNRHQKCFSNLVRQQAPHPPAIKTDSTRPKLIRQRSVELLDKRRKQMLIEHINKLITEDNQRSQKLSKSHSRSRSKASHNRSANKEDFNTQEPTQKDIHKIRKKQICKIAEEQTIKIQKRLSQAIKKVSDQIIPKHKQTKQPQHYRQQSDVVHTKSMKPMMTPSINITRTQQTETKKPSNMRVFSPNKTSTKVGLQHHPSILPTGGRSSFNKTLSHQQLSDMLSMARCRILALKSQQ